MAIDLIPPNQNLRSSFRKWSQLDNQLDENTYRLYRTGIMGSGMVACLLKSDSAVKVWNRSADKWLLLVVLRLQYPQGLVA